MFPFLPCFIPQEERKVMDEAVYQLQKGADRSWSAPLIVISGRLKNPHR